VFTRRLSLGLLSLALAAFSPAASAQTWSPEQQELWRLEELQWKLAAAKDASWIENWPGPQSKASLLLWDRYNNASATVLQQELFPISITITGNVAVVHYRYSVARENYKKDQEMVTGRYTDVLVKDGGRWLFITWAGGDDPKK
jgi:ketosteroid isomerase-like protein